MLIEKVGHGVDSKPETAGYKKVERMIELVWQFEKLPTVAELIEPLMRTKQKA